MTGSLMLLASVWILSLLITSRVVARLSLAGAMRRREPAVSALAAEARARVMLREMLTDGQYEQLTRDGFLEVPSPSVAQRLYRIPWSAGRVCMVDDGQEVAELCLQSTEPLPDSDLVVLHKLMIEGNEREYLAKANHFAPGTLGTIMMRI
ncbi:MAG TPA: hypothetical protein VGR57_15675 [Ktedonobacterales bacterium]|nr:hypothetical protein [Ktedonobacterales bacterium]